MTSDKAKEISQGIPGGTFPNGVHLCYIFNDDGERKAVMSRFMERGLAGGEKVLCLVDTLKPEEMKAELVALGVDLEARKSDFSTVDAPSSYCPEGNFDPDSLLEGVGAFRKQAIDEGFTGARISGDMLWAVRNQLDKEKLLRYEVKVTEYLKNNPFTAICEYDARQFDGSTIMDILCVHPAVIVRGQVLSNPYFIAPGEFLQRLEQRQS